MRPTFSGITVLNTWAVFVSVSHNTIIDILSFFPGYEMVKCTRIFLTSFREKKKPPHYESSTTINVDIVIGSSRANFHATVIDVVIAAIEKLRLRIVTLYTHCLLKTRYKMGC